MDAAEVTARGKRKPIADELKALKPGDETSVAPGAYTDGSGRRLVITGSGIVKLD